MDEGTDYVDALQGKLYKLRLGTTISGGHL